MFTDNLQDMVSGINTPPVKKSGPEIPATGSIITQVIDQTPDIEKVNADHYQPESEDSLIEYVNNQNSKLEMASILVKWEIGRSINSFYKGKYGDHELEKISTSTSIGTKNLRKMCRFARIYTVDQL